MYVEIDIKIIDKSKILSCAFLSFCCPRVLSMLHGEDVLQQFLKRRFRHEDS